MKRFITLNSATGLLAGSLSTFIASSAFAAGDLSFVDSVRKFFDLQQTLAQEKVYLHTDKPAYGAGETIFLKGYLVDAVTHSPLVETNFIYVELFNRNDSLVVRKKFKRTDGRFIGSVDIPVMTPTGDYYLRSYTEWMRNAPPDYFFYKPLQIGNAIVTDITPEINYTANEDGKRVMKIGFFNDEHKPYSDEKVQYTLTDKTGKVYRDRATKTNAEGVAYISLDERSMPGDDPRVDIELDNKKYDYKRSFYVNPQAEDFAVTFLPEGGRLLAGVPQIVAFKAQNERGFSETVTGHVLNTANDTVAEIGTDHDGMGKFLLTANSGDTYRAVVISATGTAKEFTLPKPETAGYALALSQNGGKAFYKILAAGNAGLSDTLYLLAHTRGQLIFTAELVPDKPAGAVSADLFPDGIAHFVLCDKTGIPKSERLAFFLKSPTIHFTVTPDKPKYNAREKATLNITLKDADGNPVQGDFSVSITDSNSVRQDTTADNIVSRLLLTSDLKGYVDCPQYYFTDNTAVKTHRDLLMLTHGWTRFKIPDFRKLPEPEINFFKEAGQFITGHIENLLGGRTKNPIVIGACWDGRDSSLRFTNTVGDENGNFLLANLDFRDTARFLIQGRTQKRIGAVSVAADSINYPASARRVYFRDNYSLLTDHYIEQSRNNYLENGGIPLLSVKEITVTANKLFDKKLGFGSDIYSAEDIKKDNIHSLFDAMKGMPGIIWKPTPPVKMPRQRSIAEKMTYLSHITGYRDPEQIIDLVEKPHKEASTEVFYYKSRFIGTYIIDNLVVPIDYLKNVDVSCIASIEFITDPIQASFHNVTLQQINFEHAVVNIRIKDRLKQLQAVSPGLTLFRTLGYSNAKEFYCPVYDTPAKKNVEKPDLRTTIYWNPALHPDSTGTVHIDYYTSDLPRKYRFDLTGITANKQPFHYTTQTN